MDDLDSERQRKGATAPRETLPRSLAEGEVAALIEKGRRTRPRSTSPSRPRISRMIETGHPREPSSLGRPAE